MKHPNIDLLKRILLKLGQTVTGKTLGRVAVEVGEVEAGTVDWKIREKILQSSGLLRTRGWRWSRSSSNVLG